MNSPRLQAAIIEERVSWIREMLARLRALPQWWTDLFKGGQVLLLTDVDRRVWVVPYQHLKVLQRICTCLEGSLVEWAITGSLGMALQGVPVEVHDIDLQTDRRGAYEIERCLAEFVVQPVRFSESERIRSHLGRLEIDGVQVEIMGDIQKRLENGSWEEPVRVTDHRRWVEIAGMRVPVLSLEYEAQAYLRLGRCDKAEMLRAWLSRRQ